MSTRRWVKIWFESHQRRVQPRSRRVFELLIHEENVPNGLGHYIYSVMTESKSKIPTIKQMVVIPAAGILLQ